MKVYGKDGRDEDFRPFAVTQYTTVEELMEMVRSNEFSIYLFSFSLRSISDRQSVRLFENRRKYQRHDFDRIIEDLEKEIIDEFEKYRSSIKKSGKT